MLRAARGMTNADIAEELGVKPHTAARWRARFAEHRLKGIKKDLPRGGRPRSREAVESEIIRRTTQETPANATHWSTRSMAEATGLSQSSISRIWRAFSLQPHRLGTFKLSNDPLFVSKVRDIVGLYMNPHGRGTCALC